MFFDGQTSQFRFIFENAPVGITVFSNSKILYANAKFVSMFGYSSVSELCDLSIYFLVAPGCYNEVVERLKLFMEGKVDRVRFETWGRRKDNSTFPFHIQAAKMELSGEPVGVCFYTDVTEYRRAQFDLEESKQRLSDIIDFLPDATFVIDCSGKVIAWNRAIEDMTGIKADEMLGKGNLEYAIPFYGVRRPILIDLVLNFDQSTAPNYYFSCKDNDGLVGEIAVPALRGAGAFLWGKATLLYDTEGRVVGAIESIRDITERKQMEKEMARLDQLNLVGEMAAGLAHEIRNPLTAVRGFAQILGGKKELGAYKEYFDLIIEETDRANSIIKEFLSLAKNKAINLKAQNLNLIIKGLLPLIISDAMISDKYVHSDLGEIPEVLLDEKEMRQLILNISRNGLESMEPGGHLTVQTYFSDEDVVLSIQDQGKGIDHECIDKIWTPFFTTKDQGTGLGLAVCYSIAVRHKATIDVKTGPEGSNFIIHFRPAMPADCLHNACS